MRGLWKWLPTHRAIKTANVKAVERVVAHKVVASSNHAITVAVAHQNALMPRGCFGGLPIHTPTPCVARENGVGKRWLRRWLLGSRANPAASARQVHITVAPLFYRSPVVGCEKPRGIGASPPLPLTGRLSAACLPLLLVACATPTVTRSCLTQKQYEQLKAAEPPRIHNKLTGKADEDTRPLAGSALELRSWGHAMLDTLKICSTP